MGKKADNGTEQEEEYVKTNHDAILRELTSLLQHPAPRVVRVAQRRLRSGFFGRAELCGPGLRQGTMPWSAGGRRRRAFPAKSCHPYSWP